MSHVDDLLKQVLDCTSAPEVAAEARRRRDLVKRAARTLPGVLRTYDAGSVGHFTVRAPVRDADCGVVLDRSVYSTLGPDSAAKEGPRPTAAAMKRHLRAASLLDEFDDLAIFHRDRALEVHFNDPLVDHNDADPHVDLIVALSRRAGGLWIPKSMNGSAPSWDASDPEAHTAAFRPADENLKRTRRRAVRLGKVWNARFTEWRFSSFNIAAFGIHALTEPTGVARALLTLLAWAADDMNAHRTADPAGVSGPITLPSSTTRAQAAERLRRAHDRMQDAIDAETEDAAREELNVLFPDHIEPPEGEATERAALADALRSRRGVEVSNRGRLVPTRASRPRHPVPDTRSWRAG